MSLPYQSPPLTIEALGADRIRLTIGATDTVRLIGWACAVACWAGAYVAQQTSQDAGGVAAVVLALTGLVFVGFMSFRKVTVLDRDGPWADQTTHAFGLSTRKRVLLGAQPTPELLSRTRGASEVDSSTGSSEYAAQIVGRSTLVVGPFRQAAEVAQADLEPLCAFFGTAPKRVRSGPGVDAWTAPLAASEASGDCPFCREALAAPAQLIECAECATGLHLECAEELGACPTLGCQNQGGRARA